MTWIFKSKNEKEIQLLNLDTATHATFRLDSEGKAALTLKFPGDLATVTDADSIERAIAHFKDAGAKIDLGKLSATDARPVPDAEPRPTETSRGPY